MPYRAAGQTIDVEGRGRIQRHHRCVLGILVARAELQVQRLDIALFEQEHTDRSALDSGRELLCAHR